MSSDITGLTVALASAYISNNPIPSDEVPALIKSIHATLNALNGAVPVIATVKLEPAVSVKKSVTSEYIICLEDGKKLKMLKRHLRSRYNLTPEEYRAKWGLPANYPMTAAAYSACRSAVAKKIGLGKRKKV